MSFGDSTRQEDSVLETLKQCQKKAEESIRVKKENVIDSDKAIA